MRVVSVCLVATSTGEHSSATPYFFLHLLLSTPPEEVFEPDLLSAVPPETWLNVAEEHFGSAVAEDDLNRLLYLDVKMTLADNDLRKVLGTAEIAGVRARFPLLDYKLAELSGCVPTELKMRGFENDSSSKKP